MQSEFVPLSGHLSTRAVAGRSPLGTLRETVGAAEKLELGVLTK